MEKYLLRTKPIRRLTVYLFDKPLGPRSREPYEMICGFDDGYFGFFQAMFVKMNQSTGRELVCWDGAIFGTKDFKLLLQIIAETRKQVAEQGDKWTVSLGYSPMYKRKLLYEVTKSKVIAILDQTEEAVRRAKSSNLYVHVNFLGEGRGTL